MMISTVFIATCIILQNLCLNTTVDLAYKEDFMLDVLIIGAGVTGCSVARELSRYQANICVVDQNEDVCSETSKANSAIVHAGFDAATGTMMAKMNVAGNAQMDQLAQELDIPFKRIGSLVVCLNEEDLPGLKALYDKGIKNGVPNLTILNKQALHEMEPNVTPDAVAALYAPTGGVVCPFAMNRQIESAPRGMIRLSVQSSITVPMGSSCRPFAKSNQGRVRFTAPCESE